MSGSLNKVMLIGNIGKEPEIRDLNNNGGKVANLRIATSESWKDKQSGERKEKTEWHAVSVFGPVAGVVETYAKVGMKVYIEGQLQTRKWQDQNGQDRYTTEIVVQGPGSTFTMLDGPGGGEGGQRGGSAGGNQGGGQRSQGGGQGGQRRDPAPRQNDGFDDDVPF